MNKRLPSATQLTLVAVILSTLGGCGESGAYQVVSTSGTIKYDDGSLIEAGRIELLFASQQPPKDAKTHPRQGVAEVNVADGTFVATTYEFEDGLIRGKHRVTAMSIAPQGGYTNAIPSIYRAADTTPLEIDAQGQDLDLVIKKP